MYYQQNREQRVRGTTYQADTGARARLYAVRNQLRYKPAEWGDGADDHQTDSGENYSGVTLETVQIILLHRNSQKY